MTNEELRKELSKTQHYLGLYIKTINRLDDFFEYNNESAKDRQKVWQILDALSAKLGSVEDD